MAEPNTVQEEKKGRPFSFYSINMTQGRLFIIFILILFFLCAVIFFIFLSLSNSLKQEVPAYSENSLDIITTEQYPSELLAEEFKPLDQEKINEILGLEQEQPQPEPATEETTSSQAQQSPTQADVIRASQFSSQSEKKQTIQSDRAVVNLPKPEQQVKRQTSPQPQTNTRKENASLPQKRQNQKRYIVQVGSFQSMTQLKKVETYYQKAGYPTYTKSKVVNGKTYYRLRVGPFKEKQRAQQYLTALKQSQFGQNSYISVGYF